MSCNPEVLKQVPLFAMLDDDETALLAGQVELKTFLPRQRIYKLGEPGGRASVVVSGNVVLKGSAWDPYPFILLNLFLSMLAAIQAPVIMMSQNRQDTKDRLRGELDFDVNRRAESEIQGLAGKLHQLTEKIDDLEELVRERR